MAPVRPLTFALANAIDTHSAAEPQDVPVIPDQRRYSARERWFQPALYRQFENAAA